MNEVMGAAREWWWAFPFGLLIISVTLGFLPGFLLRLILRIYPRESPRRQELIDELYTISYPRRFLWVFQQLETSLAEGLPLRVRRILGRNRPGVEEADCGRDRSASEDPLQHGIAAPESITKERETS